MVGGGVGGRKGGKCGSRISKSAFDLPEVTRIVQVAIHNFEVGNMCGAVVQTSAPSRHSRRSVKHLSLVRIAGRQNER